jgi:hypothetical protein
MTLAEFKAWFSGFTESMDSTPNEKQWARIRERVGEIDGVAITKTVYVDRYIERYPYRPYWHYSVNDLMIGSGYSSALSAASSAGQSSHTADAVAAFYNASVTDKDFDGHSAMLDLGKAEYLAVQ